MDDEIRCNRCKQLRPLDQFRLVRGKIDRSWCKQCYSRRYADRWANEPGFRERSRERWLKYRYGVTPQRYSELLMGQGGKCAICGTTEPGHGRDYFSVDHNHATGVIRGLLCHACNTALGLMKDSVEHLSTAASYLQNRDL